jgi:glutamate:GABA antiporter
VTASPQPALAGAGSVADGSERPARALGFRDLVLFYVVTNISLRWIATAAAAGPSSLLIWVMACAAFYVPLAFSVMELSSRHPDEGGLYVWSKRAFGDFAGFISAWTYWTSNLPYFPAILYFAASNALFVGGPHWQTLVASRLYFLIFALIGLAIPTVLNVAGLNLGKWLNNVGAFGMWLPVVIVIALGLVSWRRFGSATHFTAASLVPGTHLTDIIFWAGIFYAFGGCEAASFMGGEIKDARRNIPRALIAVGALVTFVYILGTFVVLLALPSREVSDLQGLIQALSITAQRLGVVWVIPVGALLISLSNLGASGAYLAATARLPFVAGIDHYLPSAFARLHPRYKTPHVAIWAQSIAAVVFIFLGQAGTSVRGAYQVLVSMGVIAYFIPYLFVFASLIAMQRETAGPGVIRIAGGKPVAIGLASVGIASTTLAILLATLPPADEPNKALAVAKIIGLTVVLLGAGAIIYWKGRRRASEVYSLS